MYICSGRQCQACDTLSAVANIYSDTKCKPRELELIQARYPAAVVTLLSAYYYYDLTDHIPDKYHLAMERGGTRIKDPGVIQHDVPVGTLNIGVDLTEINGTSMRIFDRERLLIETIRMRTKLPYDLYRLVAKGYNDDTADAKIVHDVVLKAINSAGFPQVSART